MPTHGYKCVFLAVLMISGCAPVGRAVAVTAGEAPPKPAETTTQPPPPNPELEALGLKVFGPHEHKGNHPEPHYRLETGRNWLDEKDPPPSAEELERLRKMPGVVNVELKDGILPYTKTPGKYVLVTKLIDLWSLADEKAWKQEMTEKYLIQRDIGKNRWVKSFDVQKSQWPEWSGSDRGSVVLFITNYGGPAQAGGRVDIYVNQDELTGFEHEFWRWAFDYWKGGIKKIGPHHVLVQEEREPVRGAMWITADGVFLTIGGNQELIETYLAKYPSALTADYQPALQKWSREEMEFRLGRMDAALADPEGLAKKPLYLYGIWMGLRQRFDFPFKGLACEKLEDFRAIRKQVAEWWEANKDKLRWNQKTRKFEVTE